MLVSPVVAVFVTELTPPIVVPTPLFSVPVTALDACPTALGFFGIVAGFAVLTAVGVGFVPSALAAGLTTGVVFFTDVVIFGVVVVEVELVVDFTGVVFAGVVTFGALIFGAALAAFLRFGPAVRVRVGDVVAGVVVFATTGVFFTGLDASPVVLLAVTGVFFTGVTLGVVEDTVFFAATGVVVAVVGVDLRTSFAGAFLIGVAVSPLVLIAVDVVFFTGVAAFFVVDAAVLVAVEGDFFTVELPPCATFWRFATPAANVRKTRHRYLEQHTL